MHCLLVNMLRSNLGRGGNSGQLTLLRSDDLVFHHCDKLICIYRDRTFVLFVNKRVHSVTESWLAKWTPFNGF